MSQNQVFKYFEEISKIPRCSFHEEKIAQYLLNFAKERGYEAIMDDYKNVTIIKEASKGYEDKPGIILQGHIDMVCEKTKDSNHNFCEDPIELVYDGNFLRANKTTLGADNGIAIAMALSLLSDEKLESPRIEFVATATEETGLVGASNYKPGILKGKYLINIDSEEEGVLIVGCAGGTDVDLEYDIERENKEGHVYKLIVHNLKGGHSGMSIHNPLLNAIKCGGKLLNTISKDNDINIIDIHGGTKHNAIPREFEVTFLSNSEIEEKIYEADLEEFKKVEENIEIELEEVSNSEEKVFSDDLTKRLIKALVELPHGVKSFMSGDYSDIVESSLNLAIVETRETFVHFKISVRSSKESKKDLIIDELKKVVSETLGKLEESNEYKAWEFKENSELRDIAVEAYREHCGKELEVSVIHAGLECAIFKEKYPQIDPISIGPNIYKVHTPEEKLDIESTNRTYEFLQYLLKKLS